MFDSIAGTIIAIWILAVVIDISAPSAQEILEDVSKDIEQLEVRGDTIIIVLKPINL